MIPPRLAYSTMNWTIFSPPPPESALHCLSHEHPCIISVDGIEHEATWSRNVWRFLYWDNGDVRTIHWDEVEEWRPTA